jgi:hypothetical protein
MMIAESAPLVRGPGPAHCESRSARLGDRHPGGGDYGRTAAGPGPDPGPEGRRRLGPNPTGAVTVLSV